MAESIQFEGANRHFVTPLLAPEDHFNGIEPMWGFTNGVLTFTRWELTPDEIMEIAKTGEIWMAVRCGPRPMQPHWVGSLSFIKRACADFGGLWGRFRRRPRSPDPGQSRPREPA